LDSFSFMLTATTRLFVTLIFTAWLFVKADAQAGICPDNLDFERGDFTNWFCQTGDVIVSGGVNKIIWTGAGQVNNRHTIIPAATAGRDTYGRFARNCPNGSGFSVQLGNNSGGHQAESISYTYTIPATATVFSILFNYAVVFQDPNHLPEEQPRFRAKITDLTTNSTIPCVTFDFTASASLPGFIRSSVDPTVFYKDWTPVTINLSTFAGKTIQLEFTTSDCTFTAHFGYAYIDVNTACNGAITGNYVCPGNNDITLTAPFGFQNYTWYADNTFATTLSTTQTLTLNPVPAAGTIFPVVVEPFAGFGCRDTLYGIVQVGTTPASVAGADASTCTNVQLQLGAASQPGLSYSWTPAAYLNSSTIANPTTLSPPGTPTEFIVQTTDILTGCFSYDTTYITGLQADTALSINGKNIYCEGDAAAGILSVSNSLVAVQWYYGNTPIPGATAFNYQPTTTGNYWAQVQQLGCTDSTRETAFVISPIPVSLAGADGNVCINQTKQIGTATNPAYNYAWIPAAQVSDATISNPQAWAIGSAPQEFIVHTTNATTGCNSYDTIVITGLVMDTAITLNGKNDYCNGDPAKGTLSVNNLLQAVQWYDGNTIIPGATSFNYQPTVTGSYWAQMKQTGCTDSTRTVLFNIHAVPVADFRLSNDSACITNHSFTFTNNSSVSDGAAITYLWNFSDGTTQAITDAVKTFTSPGSYKIRLTTTTSFGCINSTSDSTVHVMPNGKSGFIWDSICINRPVQFRNLSRENGSPQINYNWKFNNGGADYSLKNPPLITYINPGATDVTLKLIALGCESYPDSVIQRVQVNKPKDGVRYKDITVPQFTSRFIHVRDTVGKIYNWRPPMHLRNYNTGYTEFYANGNDVKYLVDITDLHTCVTIDTLLMQVLKKPGYYLPTAFTPNGDGLNDVAIPYLVGMKSLKSFSVFNRWGNRVFYTTKYEHGWDGTFNGKPQDVAVYVWILEFYDSNNHLVTEKGTISIIR
jgi:gliding motility-associated-like protein